MNAVATTPDPHDAHGTADRHDARASAADAALRAPAVGAEAAASLAPSPTRPPRSRNPWPRRVGSGVLAVLAVAILIVATLYVIDHPVDARVESKQCGGGIITFLPQQQARVTVRVLALDRLVTLDDLPPDQCALVNDGNHVRYHIRSGRTSIWQYEGGPCIWDSLYGLFGCDR